MRRGECKHFCYVLLSDMAKKDDQQTNVRLPTDLKERITAAAQEAGRSFTAEVVRRLEASFESVLEASLLQARMTERQALEDAISTCEQKLDVLSKELAEFTGVDPLEAEEKGIADMIQRGILSIVNDRRLVEGERDRLKDYLARVNDDISAIAHGLKGKLRDINVAETSPWRRS